MVDIVFLVLAIILKGGNPISFLSIVYKQTFIRYNRLERGII